MSKTGSESCLIPPSIPLCYCVKRTVLWNAYFKVCVVWWKWRSAGGGGAVLRAAAVWVEVMQWWRCGDGGGGGGWWEGCPPAEPTPRFHRLTHTPLDFFFFLSLPPCLPFVQGRIMVSTSWGNYACHPFYFFNTRSTPGHAREPVYPYFFLPPSFFFISSSFSSSSSSSSSSPIPYSWTNSLYFLLYLVYCLSLW